MDENKSKIWSSIITLLLTVAILLLLVGTHISVQYPPKGINHLACMNEDSIYVETEDIPLPMGGEQQVATDDLSPESNGEPEEGASAADQGPDQPAETQHEGNDLNDAGKVSPERPKLVTSPKESPMKINRKPQVKPTGAAKENPKPASKPAVKARTETKSASASKTSSQSSAISKRMKNAFGQGRDSRAGSSSASSSGGKGTARSGHASLGSGLVGYTGEYFGRPHSTVEGTVIVQVHVNARGYVTQARVVGGTIANSAARKSCIIESKKSRFSVPKNRTTEGIGTIVWRFK